MPVLTAYLEIDGQPSGKRVGDSPPFAKIASFLIREIAGFHIGIIGLITPGLPYSLARRAHSDRSRRRCHCRDENDLAEEEIALPSGTVTQMPCGKDQPGRPNGQERLIAAGIHHALNSYDAQSGGQRFPKLQRILGEPESQTPFHPIETRDDLTRIV